MKLLHPVSQTLGIERGLHDILEACASLGVNVKLHLRGQVSEERKSVILNFAERYGVTKSIKFHSLIEHDELVKSMGQYDVGLGLERPDHQNYGRTVTNKVFSYLLAGLAIAATDTPGQRGCVPWLAGLSGYTNPPVPAINHRYLLASAHDALEWSRNSEPSAAVPGRTGTARTSMGTERVLESRF